jgi:hypothetical protein
MNQGWFEEEQKRAILFVQWDRLCGGHRLRPRVDQSTLAQAKGCGEAWFIGRAIGGLSLPPQHPLPGSRGPW